MKYIKTTVDVGDKIIDKATNVELTVDSISKTRTGVKIFASDTIDTFEYWDNEAGKAFIIPDSDNWSISPVIETSDVLERLEILEDYGGFVLNDQKSQYLQIVGLISDTAFKTSKNIIK